MILYLLQNMIDTLFNTKQSGCSGCLEIILTKTKTLGWCYDKQICLLHLFYEFHRHTRNNFLRRVQIIGSISLNIFYPSFIRPPDW